MVGKTKAPTVAEAARFEKIVALGCAACGFAPRCPCRTEAHHLLSGGKRRGHKYTIPLCSWHHRGEPPSGFTTREATVAFGPSLRLESRAFHARYGSDDELLGQVNELIYPTEAA